MRALSSLLATEPVGRGPSPTFAAPHLLLAFLVIGERGTIGRQALAREAGLGEGAARTVLKRFREGGYVGVNASGAFLTGRGKRVLHVIQERLLPFVELGNSRLTVGNDQVAIGVRGSRRRLGSGIVQRDSAIMVGAVAATSYEIHGSRFAVPGGSNDCEKEFPSDAWKLLRRRLLPKNGDIVIVCGAQSLLKARLGALSAALTLL